MAGIDPTAVPTAASASVPPALVDTLTPEQRAEAIVTTEPGLDAIRRGDTFALEALIAAAYIEAFHDWELWADEQLKGIDDPLEDLVMPMRLFLRVKKTHPVYAAMSARNLADIPKYFHGTEEGLVEHIGELMKKKIIDIESPAIRIRSLSACILAGLADQLLNPAAKDSDADATVEVILSILGISPAKAKKLAHGPMPDLSK